MLSCILNSGWVALIVAEPPSDLLSVTGVRFSLMPTLASTPTTGRRNACAWAARYSAESASARDAR